MTKPQEDQNKQPATPATKPEDGAESAELIYEERREFFLADLISKAESEGVEIAVALIIDPKLQGRSILFSTGSNYNIAKVSNQLAKYFKAQLDSEFTL